MWSARQVAIGGFGVFLRGMDRNGDFWLRGKCAPVCLLAGGDIIRVAGQTMYPRTLDGLKRQFGFARQTSQLWALLGLYRVRAYWMVRGSGDWSLCWDRGEHRAIYRSLHSSLPLRVEPVQLSPIQLGMSTNYLPEITYQGSTMCFLPSGVIGIHDASSRRHVTPRMRDQKQESDVEHYRERQMNTRTRRPTRGEKCNLCGADITAVVRSQITGETG